MATRYQKYQQRALWIAWVCGVLAFLTGTGCGLVATDEPDWVVWIHPLLLVWGCVFGVLTLGRQKEVEARRYELSQDLDLTKSEQEWAQKDAESESIRAGGTFLAAAILLAGWLSYQFRGEIRSLIVDMMPATALIGFGLGLVGAYVLERSRRKRRQETTSL